MSMPIETELPSLARELGLTRRQREEIAYSGLVRTRVDRKRTMISDKDAELIRQAVTAAKVVGGAVAVIAILRLLVGGAVKPNVP